MENSNINISSELLAELTKLIPKIQGGTQSKPNEEYYGDYIYIAKQARYYSIPLKSFFTIREVISNLQAFTGDISISERTILDARKNGEIKIYNDFCFGEDETGKYNLYDNSLILKADMENPNLHSLIQELLEDVTNDNSADKEYILKWIGWKYFHPLSPMCSGLVFKGSQGSGKGHMVTLLQTIFGNTYTKLNISPDNFGSRFSVIEEHTLICELAEQSSTDNNTADKVSTKLKTLVMQNELQVEKKYKDLETIKNHTAFIITSNEHNPIKLDAQQVGNRRYSFFQGDKTYDDMKGAEIRAVITDKYEIAKLLGYICHTWGELKNMPVLAAHKNEVKEILEQSAGNEFQHFWNYLREIHMGELISDKDLRIKFITFCKERGYRFMKVSQLINECPWGEVRPDSEDGEQLKRHRLVQPIGGIIKSGGLHKLILQDRQTERVNDIRERVPVSLKELENIF